LKQFRSETGGVFHHATNFGNLGRKSNGKVRFGSVRFTSGGGPL